MRLPRERFPYSPISRRTPWKLPNGARIAVGLIGRFMPLALAQRRHQE